MTPGQFRICCAGDLFSARYRWNIHIPLQYILKYKGYEQCLVLLLPPEFKNGSIYSQRMLYLKIYEVLPCAVQKPDKNCRLNEFLYSSLLLLDIWKSHKMDYPSQWHSSFEYVENRQITYYGSNGLFTFLIARWRYTFYIRFKIFWILAATHVLPLFPIPWGSATGTGILSKSMISSF